MVLNNRMTAGFPLELSDYYSRAQAYFMSLDDFYAKLYLYERYYEMDRSMPYIYRIMNAIGLFDYETAVNYLGSSDPARQKAGLFLANMKKMYYVKDDIHRLAALCDGIKNIFKRRATDVEVSSFLSSSVKRKWKCECGNVNGESVEYCATCGLDEYGFKSTQIKPSVVLENLALRIAALEKYYE